jgi:hypothetical protein
MAFLTSRTLSTGITGSDLIHIVNPFDNTQNPAGSSYKASIDQVKDYISIYITSASTFLTTSAITTSAETIVSGVSYYGVSYIGNVDITLFDPTSLDGINIRIKDEGGTSGTYRIRLIASVGLIDGNPYVDMNINYMSLTLVARNNNWWII